MCGLKVLVAWASIAIALSHPQAAALAGGKIRLATWNIETLTTGKLVFPDASTRSPGDIELLRNFVKSVPADVIALQEMASPAAIAQLFPLSEWRVCISGQFFADNKDDFGTRGATCFDTGPLPDTPERETFAKQYVAFAVRRSAGIDLSVTDVPSLGIDHEDPKDGSKRAVRWGLVAEFERSGQSLRILNLHLKSRCRSGTPQRAAKHQDNAADCDTLFRQFKPLRETIAELGLPFVVAGDFNRVIRYRGDLWKRIFSARKNAEDHIGLTRVPSGKQTDCGGEREVEGVDYFLVSKGVTAADFKVLQPTIEFGSDPTTVRRKFSDHCPLSVSIDF